MTVWKLHQKSLGLLYLLMHSFAGIDVLSLIGLMFPFVFNASSKYSSSVPVAPFISISSVKSLPRVNDLNNVPYLLTVLIGLVKKNTLEQTRISVNVSPNPRRFRHLPWRARVLTSG